MLDKPEVLAGVTERPRFLPWELVTVTYSRQLSTLYLFGIFSLRLTREEDRELSIDEQKNNLQKYFVKLIHIQTTTG